MRVCGVFKNLSNEYEYQYMTMVSSSRKCLKSSDDSSGILQREEFVEELAGPNESE
jgi:hypothetical protein